MRPCSLFLVTDLDSLLFWTSAQKSRFALLVCTNMSKILRAQQAHVENNGFEPLTPCLQSRCSSQLS